MQIFCLCIILQASLTSKVVQSMSLGWLTKSHKRVEFVRMRGPHSKGHAEMAVSRVKGSGPETPDIENFPVNDFEDLDSQQQVCPCENLLLFVASDTYC